MDPSRWQRVQEIFHSALDLPSGEREAFVRRQVRGDAELAEQVHQLLAADEDTDPLLSDDGIASLARRLLPTEEPPIEQIGPYRIEREIGRGGMGVVYVAKREDLDTRYAVKVLTDAGLSPERYRRFLSEQHILARLEHPAIARLHDAGNLDSGTPYIVMELVDGAPITDHCEAENLPLIDRLEIFRKACEAVLFAHRQAIVHRDLKPSNILVRSDADRDGPSVKLLDFGIAKIIDDEDNGHTSTQLRLMTPAYAAPEQALGKPVGVYTDVYALGVLLYELLAGDKPHDLSAMTPSRAERVLVHEDPEPPSVRRQRCAPRGIHASRAEWNDLDVLCMKTLQKAPERRYGSVEALIRDIDRFLAGEPLEARPEALAYRLGKFARRHRRDLIVAAALLITVVGLTGVYGWQLARARDAAVVEARRAQRVQQFMLSLFGDRAAGPPADLKVTDLLERGIREADALEREPGTQAALFATLGQIHAQLGEFGRAEELVERSLTLRRETYGARAAETAASLMTRAMLRVEQSGDLDAAEEDASEALRIVRRHRGANAPERARALTTLGVVETAKGRYEQAITKLERAVAIEERRGASRRLAEMLGHLATAHAYAESYEASDALHERLLEMEARVFGTRHPQYAATLLNLGSTKTERGEHEEAERLTRRALAIHRDYYGGDHLATASNLSVLGEVLFKQGRFDEAERALSKALEIREKRLGPNHRLIGVTLSHLSNVATRRGQLDRAQQLLARQLAIYREAFSGPHRWIATVSSNLATVEYKRGDIDRAAAHLRQAAAMYDETLPAPSVQGAIARIKLGQVLIELERYDEAEAALTSGRHAIEGRLSESSMWFDQVDEALSDLRAARSSQDRP